MKGTLVIAAAVARSTRNTTPRHRRPVSAAARRSHLYLASAPPS